MGARARRRGRVSKFGKHAMEEFRRQTEVQVD